MQSADDPRAEAGGRHIRASRKLAGRTSDSFLMSRCHYGYTADRNAWKIGWRRVGGIDLAAEHEIRAGVFGQKCLMDYERRSHNIVKGRCIQRAGPPTSRPLMKQCRVWVLPLSSALMLNLPEPTTKVQVTRIPLNFAGNVSYQPFSLRVTLLPQASAVPLARTATSAPSRCTGLLETGSSKPHHSVEVTQFANGIDERPLIPAVEPAKSFSQQETFARDLTDEEYLEAVLRRMADHLFAKVRQERKSIRTLTVKVRYNDMAEDQCSESLIEPTDL